MTVIPTGQMGKAMVNAQNLFAESEAFQDAIGATGTPEEKKAAAKERIYLTAYIPEDESEEDFERPFILIANCGNNQADAFGTGTGLEFGHSGSLEVRMEREIPEEYQGDDDNAELDFLNIVDGIMADVNALTGKASYFCINNWSVVEGPTQFESQGSQKNIYAIRLLIGWGLK